MTGQRIAPDGMFPRFDSHTEFLRLLRGHDRWALAKHSFFLSSHMCFNSFL